jgi:hypothetical protein
VATGEAFGVAWSLPFPTLLVHTSACGTPHTPLRMSRPIATRQYFYAGYKGSKKLGIQKKRRREMEMDVYKSEISESVSVKSRNIDIRFRIHF